MEQKKLLDTLDLTNTSHARLMKIYNSGVCSNNYSQLANLIESINNLSIVKQTLEQALANHTTTSEAPEL